MSDESPSLFTKTMATITLLMTITGGIGKWIDTSNDHLTKCDEVAEQLYRKVREYKHRPYKSFEKIYHNRDEYCESWTVKEIYDLGTTDRQVARKNTNIIPPKNNRSSK